MLLLLPVSHRGSSRIAHAGDLVGQCDRLAHADHVAVGELVGAGDALAVNERPICAAQVLDAVAPGRRSDQPRVVSRDLRVVDHDVICNVTPDGDGLAGQVVLLVGMLRRSPLYLQD